MSTVIPAPEGGSKILGREPVFWLGVIGTAIQLFSALVLPLSGAQQGVLNAVAVAVLGFVGAAMVSAESAVPAAVGVLQAGLALGVAFGWDLSADAQSAVMAFATTVAAFATRQMVVSPVPPPSTLIQGYSATLVAPEQVDEHEVRKGGPRL